MKVALVCGCWQAGRCGVGDYSGQLALALERQGAEVLRFGAAPQQLGSLHAAAAARSLRRSGADVVHIQYPTVGYGRSLLPALLPLLMGNVPTLVTLHEFSIFRPYRWPWFAPFAYAADAVILTSDAERRCFARRMPGARAATQVIEIGSNISRGRTAARDPRSVCYFGLFMPGKGIEKFFALVAGLRASGCAWRAALIGAPAAGMESYAAEVRRQAQALGIEVHAALPSEGVGDVLQTITYAYLPGPGGITERRGAVLAALENDVTVIGPAGDGAPAWLRARIIDAATPDDACRLLLAGGAPAASIIGPDDAVTGWENIARRHMDLYKTLGAAAALVAA